MNVKLSVTAAGRSASLTSWTWFILNCSETKFVCQKINWLQTRTCQWSTADGKSCDVKFTYSADSLIETWREMLQTCIIRLWYFLTPFLRCLVPTLCLGCQIYSLFVHCRTSCATFQCCGLTKLSRPNLWIWCCEISTTIFLISSATIQLAAYKLPPIWFWCFSTNNTWEHFLQQLKDDDVDTSKTSYGAKYIQ